MALQGIKYGMPLPAPPALVTGAPTLATNAIDAAGEKTAIICRASATKSIRKIHFRLSTVTTGDTLDVRVETVDATTGNPTGTLWAANTNVSKAIVVGDANTWVVTANLTADASVNAGDVFALVIANGGGGGNFLVARYEDQSLGGGFPYGAHFTASWSKQATQSVIVPEYSDGSFEPIFGVLEMGAINTQSFASNTATTERGNRFSLPFPARASGVWFWGQGSGDFSVKLYDSDGTTVLATTGTIDKDIKQTAANGIQYLPFTSTVSLLKNTTYRVAVVAETTTALTIFDVDVASAAMMDLYPGGSSLYRSVKTSGNWVDTATSRTYMGVYFDGFDDGSGGSYAFAV